MAIKPHIGIMTLNVQHASSERSRKQVRWLSDQDNADIVVLTEVAAGKSAHTLVERLEASGYEVIMPSDATSEYRVIVASRIGVIGPGVLASPVPHRCVPVQVAVGSTTLDIVGVYVPSRGPVNQRNVAKRLFQNKLSDLLSSYSETIRSKRSTIMVAGDLNVVEPNHIPFHRVFGEWEYDFYRSFETYGLTDAFRHLSPTQVQHSWYGRKSGSGYRFDHIFTNRPEALVSCKYVHEPRTLGLSDHSAIVAVFKLVLLDSYEQESSIPSKKRPRFET
jgi:exonuclease III